MSISQVEYLRLNISGATISSILGVARVGAAAGLVVFVLDRGAAGVVSRGYNPNVRIRRLMLAVIAVGIAGTTTDLLLLAHYEDTAQLIPLALLITALPAIAWYLSRPGSASTRMLQLAMGLFVLTGFIGVGFHVSGSLEFQREIDPEQSWTQLIPKVVRAKAPPMLAPGVMILMGLMGLTCTLYSRTES